MATARKLPSGNWRIRQYGQSFTAETKTEAELMAALYGTDKKKEKKKKQKPVQMTVGQAIDSYIEGRTAILSPSTIVGYKQIRKTHMKDLMDVQIMRIDQPTIQRVINEEAKTHKPNTIRNMHGLLSAAISEFRPDFVLKTNLPPPKRQAMSIPDDEAIEALLSQAGRNLLSAILIGSFGGLRRSEICALEWSDLQVEKRRINVNKSLVFGPDKKWVLKDATKTYESTRVVRVPAFVFDNLLTIERTCDRIVPVCPDTITNQFLLLRKKIGFSFRFHDLRHYHASIMLALGVPDKYAMEQMGHATAHMLKRVYQHTFEDRKDIFMEQVDTYATEKFATKIATKKESR